MFRLFLLAILALSLVLMLVPNIIWCLSWAIGKCINHSVPYPPFAWTGAGLVAVLWTVLAYGFFVGRWRLEVKHVPFHSTELPESFSGFRIVHISDLHLSTFDDNHAALDRIVDSINAQQPDLICFTGDMVSLSAEEAWPYVGALRRLRARHGVAAVLGNHDFMIYSRQYKTPADRVRALDRLVALQRDTLGWHLLRNEAMVIHRGEDSITIVGVDNCNRSHQGFHTIDRGDLPRAMKGTSGFSILLSHDPSHWQAEVLPETDIPLTLSGHTHAAQIRLMGWTPAAWTFAETDGMYRQGGQSLYINIGLGCTAPFRLGAVPEVTVLELEREGKE